MEISFDKKITGEQEMVVTENNSAKYFGSELDGILGTPALVGFMETTAQKSVLKSLPPGYITIGYEVSVNHLKIVKVGKTIKCITELIKTEGKKLFFKAIVTNNNDVIGEATLSQYLVEAAKVKRILPRF